MSQAKRKSKDDSESGAPEAKIRGAPKADLVKLKLQNTTKFDTKLLENSKYEHDDVVTLMKPEDFTMDYYHKEGLKKVLVFDCDPNELKMKVPMSTFTPRDVMNLVGKNRSVKYFYVPTQTEFTTSFEDFVDYFETPADSRMYSYNVISLEVSGTGMMDLVHAPALVRQIDLASAWPDERKQREISFDVSAEHPTIFNYINKYPRVEHFCLMSASASYTGFHIDFHGSSVWYHVVNGEKVFFIIESTEENIRKYEEYLKRKNDFEFFGDLVDKCTRITVKPGQTLMLPSGWIHSVYTPMDTLVFGGNFIHPLSLKMQMRIVRHENELELKKHEKYPQADEVVFHYMDDVVRRVTGRRHIRPSSINRQKEGLQYVGDKFIELKRHRDIPDANDFKENRQERWRLASNATIPEAWQDVEESDQYEEMTRIFSKFDEMKADVDTDDWFIEEHPHIFYHPKEFDVDSRLKGSNPCRKPLPLRFRMDDVKKDVNDAILRQCIHPSEVVEWEALIEELLTKETVNLPEGLTRPNSLVHSFYALLSIVRRRESRKPRTDVTKYYVLPRVCRLDERWNQKNSFDIQRRRHASVAPNGAKWSIDKIRSKSIAPGPAKRARIDQENTEPPVFSYAANLNSLKTLMDTVVSTTVGSVLSAAAAESVEMDPSIRAALATLQQTCASIIAAPVPAPAAPTASTPTATAAMAPSTSPTRSAFSRDATPTAFSPAAEPESAHSARPKGLSYTDEENETIIRICREWMLGYDDRMAKIEEAIEAKGYASKIAEAMTIGRAKQRKPRLLAVENVNTAFKALPNRSERSIRAQIQRLKNEPALKAIVEQFETGTLTSITAPAPAPVDPLLETTSTPSSADAPAEPVSTGVEAPAFVPAHFTPPTIPNVLIPIVSNPATIVPPLPTSPTAHSHERLEEVATPSIPDSPSTPLTSDAILTVDDISTPSIPEDDTPMPDINANVMGSSFLPWTDDEDQVVIRLCREWLLGYDDRMAKIEEANEARVYSSKHAESIGRARAEKPKPRKPHLLSAENIGNILKELPDRNERGIRDRIRKLTKRPSLNTILEQFENGTLTAASTPILSSTPIPSTPTESRSTPSTPHPSVADSILPTADADSDDISSPNPTPFATLKPDEKQTSASSTRTNPFGQPWTDHENDVIIQQCREWLLGYDERMAKIQSNAADSISRGTANGSKPRKPYLFNAENIALIFKKLPERSEKSIPHQIRKLKSQPALTSILEHFENGTLTAQNAPSATSSITVIVDDVPVEQVKGPWSDRENKVLIRLCREWLLGYDDRIAKSAEARAARVYSSKHVELAARARANEPKPREPGFRHAEHIANIRKVMPERSADSINHQIRKLKRGPILKAILKKFEKGTLH